MNEKLILVIKDTDDPRFLNHLTRGGELFEYLSLFHKTYSSFANAVLQNKLQLAIGESLAASGSRAINECSFSYSDIHNVQYEIDERENTNEFLIESIHKNSPLEIVLVGIPIALTAAVILSGGKVEASEFKFELPPIGVGIKKLKEALSSNSKDSNENESNS